MQDWTPERKLSAAQMQVESVTAQPVLAMLETAQLMAQAGRLVRSWAVTRPSRESVARARKFIVLYCLNVALTRFRRIQCKMVR